MTTIAELEPETPTVRIKPKWLDLSAGQTDWIAELDDTALVESLSELQLASGRLLRARSWTQEIYAQIQRLVRLHEQEIVKRFTVAHTPALNRLAKGLTPQST